MKLLLNILFIVAVGMSVSMGQERGISETTAARVYDAWTVFFHPRFGFELPIPPGVRAVGIPEEADQPRFQSADGSFVMSAWGGILNDSPSRVIARQWDEARAKHGPEITYQRRGTTWFVVSGTDNRGIEFYEKFMMRGPHVAFLDITFPKAQIRQFEAWVEEIEDGFRPVPLRDGLPETVPASQKEPRPMAKTMPPATQPTPETKQIKPSPPKQSRAEIVPTARKADGKPGFVYSPFSENYRLVDVTGMPSGSKAKCPYTMKIFRVP